MSKLLWFVVGMITGEFCVSWVPHIIYLSIITALLFGRHYFSC